MAGMHAAMMSSSRTGFLVFAATDAALTVALLKDPVFYRAVS
jgi:hypothetical protein